MTYGSRNEPMDYYIPEEDLTDEFDGEGIKEVFGKVKKKATKAVKNVKTALKNLDPKAIKILKDTAMSIVKGEPIREAITGAVIDLGNMGIDWLKEQDIWEIIDKILKKSGKGGLMTFGGSNSYVEWDDTESNVWYSSEIATFGPSSKVGLIETSDKPQLRKTERFTTKKDTHDQSKPSNEDIIAMLFK
jgi:hypothetical protein